MGSLAGQRSPPRETSDALQTFVDGEGGPVIIGGMVLDIHATPSIPANPRTTTPGRVHYSLGGVARNVAECVSKLGINPYMISAVGFDMAGNLLLEHWKSSGLSTEGIRRCHDIETAVVCNVFDVAGELAAAVASVESIVVAADSDIPVWFEPVSVAKSKRVASVAKYQMLYFQITFASPNEDELIAMANALSFGDVFSPVQTSGGKSKCSIESLFQMLKPAIWVLLEKGIKVVVLTLGSNGVLLCAKVGPSFKQISLKRKKPQGFGGLLHELVNSTCAPGRFFSAKREESSNLFAVHFPAISASVVRLTGAGDCLVGGTLASICAGLDVMQSLAVGVAAAKAAVEVETNVPAEYSLEKIA
ncbi:hypothetical protein RJ639_045010, partial [Escallonia herrerae]